MVFNVLITYDVLHSVGHIVLCTISVLSTHQKFTKHALTFKHLLSPLSLHNTLL